jgi:Kinetochore complex Sim4 subunit Fta1
VINTLTRSPKFLESLTTIVTTSTAISLSGLSLSRVVCGGMLVDSAGKMKILDSAGVDGTKFILGKIVTCAAVDVQM